jgi:uncharacterized protein
MNRSIQFAKYKGANMQTRILRGQLLGTIAVALGYLSTMTISMPLNAASFDCTRATSVSEKAICRDAGLSKQDEQLAGAFKSAQALWPSTNWTTFLKNDQRFWLNDSRDMVCKGDADCLKRNYELRIAYLSNPLIRYTGRYVSGVCAKADAKKDTKNKKSDGIFLDATLTREGKLAIELYLCPSPRGNMLLQGDGAVDASHILTITQAGCKNTVTFDAEGATIAVPAGAKSCAVLIPDVSRYQRDPTRNPFFGE